MVSGDVGVVNGDVGVASADVGVVMTCGNVLVPM